MAHSFREFVLFTTFSAQGRKAGHQASASKGVWLTDQILACSMYCDTWTSSLFQNEYRDEDYELITGAEKRNQARQPPR